MRLVRRRYRLSDIELASRLSFFLWSSIPDERCWMLAERGERQAGRARTAGPAHAGGSARTAALVDDFAAQWLNLRRVGEVVVHPDFYPDFDDNLLEALRRETELFIASTLRDDRSVARSAARRLHVRQRTAGASLPDSWDLRHRFPSCDAAQSRAARRTARAGRASSRPRRIRIAPRRCSGASGCSTTSSASTCRRRRRTWTRPDGDQGRHAAADDPRAARAASDQSGLRQLPRGDRSAWLRARELRRHRRMADDRRIRQAGRCRRHDRERRAGRTGSPACGRCCCSRPEQFPTT